MMAIRWLLACGLITLTAAFASAQAPQRPAPGPDCLDQPTQYPPLLRPPASSDPPLAVVPRGPTGAYDHGQLYLPDYVPPSPPEACRPLGRWWISPAFEFAWISSRPAGSSLRLPVPTIGGGTFPGPVLPVAGRSSESFRPGFSLSGGIWFNDDNIRGVEASFFTLGGGDNTFHGFARDMLVLFPDGDGSAPQLIVLPPRLPIIGIFPFTLATWFTGADVNYRRNLHCGPCARLDLVAGYRFAFLQDELFLGEPPYGSEDDYRWNRFTVSNWFHGGQIGLVGEYRSDVWSISAAAKVALGSVTSEVCASGLFNDARTVGPGGTLAALGDSTRERFAVLPTAGVQVARQLGAHTRAFAGYTFQYLSQAARLGDVLNSTATGLEFTDFWVQSLNLGLEFRY